MHFKQLWLPPARATEDGAWQWRRRRAVVATEANTMELMQIEPWPHYARRLRRNGALAGRLSLLRETVAPSRFRLAYEVEEEPIER